MINLLKSSFISTFLAVATLILLIAISQLWQQMSWLWFGVLISTLPLLTVIGYFFLLGTARTQKNLWPMLICSCIGLLLVVFSLLYLEPTSTQALLLSITAFSGHLLYVFWYSRFEQRDKSSLQKGKPLADFKLKALSGETVSSSDFKSRQSLLIFYRGNWCPLCIAQIKEVAQQYQKLSKMGVRIALISPQPVKHSQALADKFSVDFEYYVDEDNTAAKKLGIHAKNGLPLGLQVLGYQSDTVLPTVIITDTDNKIIFADLTDNYRVRPEPETFLKVLEQHSLNSH